MGFQVGGRGFAVGSAGSGKFAGDRGSAGEYELGPGVVSGQVRDESAGVMGQCGGGGEQS